jgi:putative ABC transport system permease protein
MKLTDIICLAVSNLWRRRLRTVLTVLGVIIGTASIIVMVALGLGNMEEFNRNFIQNTNLTEIQVISNMGSKGRGNQQVNESSIKTFKQMPGVTAAAAVLDIPVLIRVGNYEAEMQVKAMDSEALRGLEIEKGSIFTSETMAELLLGGNALADFHEIGHNDWLNVKSGKDRKAPDIDWLNQRVEILFGGRSSLEAKTDSPKPRTYRGKISGYTKIDEMKENSYITYMNLSVAKKMLRENYKLLDGMGLKMNSYTSAIIYAKDIDSVVPVLEKVKEMGYNAYSPTEYIESTKKEQRRQQGQLSMIAIISLLVSAIGIANTMLTGIMERRSEIGVMKVVGLSIKKINLIFLLESTLIGLTGGLTGSLIGYIIAFIVNNNTDEAVIFGMYFGEGARLIIPFWLTLTTMGISAGVGMLSGVYPSWKATKMSPLEAIRSSN